MDWAAAAPILFSVLYASATLFGLLGNAASALVFAFHPDFRKVQYSTLLLALAAADTCYLIVTAFNQPEW